MLESAGGVPDRRTAFVRSASGRLPMLRRYVAELLDSSVATEAPWRRVAADRLTFAATASHTWRHQNSPTGLKLTARQGGSRGRAASSRQRAGSHEGSP